MKRIVLGTIMAIASASAMAKDISCAGTLIDVDIDPRMAFPYAVVYDAENYRTCMLDRGRAGHDPLRGLCNVGETCTISGPYKRQIRDTYILDFGDRGVHVKALEGLPLRQEVPSGK
jgi:hypothetical protein